MQPIERNTIIILEDDANRLREFQASVFKLGAQYRLCAWRDARRFMAECHTALAQTALISLDHDLNKESPSSPDPGDGVDVASFLGRLPCLCPVILHTSNADRVWSMHNELRFGGWPAERVMPLGQDWIQQSWVPMARKLLTRFHDSSEEYFQPVRSENHAERFERVLLSLHGLAIGDGLGEMMFSRPDKARDLIVHDDLPPSPWWHTDDTEMAISIVEVLRLLGTTHQDALAQQFAWRFELEPDRGYGGGARRQLRSIVEGADWRATSREAFSGQGSMGNGSAMRVAPVGAWFADDLERVAAEARASSLVTHMNPEGVAGAVTVAIAAGMAWRLRAQSGPDSVTQFFNEVHRYTPESETRRGIEKAYHLRDQSSAQAVARQLGNGSGVICPDTVPFAVWAAAKHLHDYRQALAVTASVGGDIDTNCAIVGGMVALSVGWPGIPTHWLQSMEALPYGKPIQLG